MLTFQALPSPNPLRTKKYWLKMTFTVAVAVLITVLLTAQMVITQANSGSQSMGNSPGTYTRDVLTGSIILNPDGQYLTGFNVPSDAKNAVLWGNYSVVQNSTNNNMATMTIWSQQEIINYFSCEDAVSCYNKEMYPMRSDNLNSTLLKGNYFILICGGGFDTNVLEANLYLNFTV